MIIVAIIILLSAPQAGYASQYARGVMPRVIEIRQKWEQLPEDLSAYTVYAACQECSDIGREFYIRRPNGEWEAGICTDCASKSDHQSDVDLRSGWQWMKDNNILVEIDYETASRWNVVGQCVPVEIAYPIQRVTIQEVPDEGIKGGVRGTDSSCCDRGIAAGSCCTSKP